ncbi:MAG: prepilin-type cleavage/methylation domain-containing protein [Polyangiaceae bacterium]
MTLIETLVTLAIIALISGVAVLGLGARTGAKLKSSAAQLTGSIRIAYAHSISTSKSVRLVFDFGAHKTTLEEAPQRHLIKHELSGGATAASELEAAALEASQTIANGPVAPRAQFEGAKAFGIPKDGRDLESGINFWRVYTTHDPEPVSEGRAYLYFFPNGQTESASIQLRISNSDEAEESNYLTVVVSPLTGRTEVKRGRVEITPPRDDREASERDE